MWRSAQRIGDRYRLVERLGTGGMSVVWRGYDEILGRDVAVKVLSPHLARDDAFRDRLRQEALAAARLCHPHVTGVFDFGESPLSEHVTVPYVVMELNDGESVAARLRRDGPLPWREAVTVAAEVASALATAHARGVVHRDVTPANVMLTSAGAKVVDFGISALVGQRDAAPDGSLLGTPAYLAPERLNGRPVSPATDVYALGLLLYRALTGRFPWPAANTTEALRAHLYADPEPLPSLAGLPADVAALCLRCLAKDPHDRPAAAEVAQRLGAVVMPSASLSSLPSPSPAPAFSSPPSVAASSSGSSLFPPPSLPPASSLPPSRVLPSAPSHPSSRPLPAGGAIASSTAIPSPLFTHIRRSAVVAGLVRRAASGRALRLRAGLRLAAALRLGRVQALGGGLFRGGNLRREVLTGGRLGDALVAGRHRVQAAALTVTLVTTVGVTWAADREPDQVGPAQAAAAGPGTAAGVRHEAECKVRYQVERDSGTDFEARLTVLNTGDGARDGWRVEFAYPGSQRLTDVAATVAQKGRRIVVRGGGELAAGRAATVLLRGAYRTTNPMPLAFRLNGHICTAEVLGATTVPVVSASPTKTAKPKRRGTSSVRKPSATSSPAPQRSRTPRATPPEPPRVRPPAPAPPPTSATPRRPAPSPPELQPRRAGGFSVAV